MKVEELIEELQDHTRTPPQEPSYLGQDHRLDVEFVDPAGNRFRVVGGSDEPDSWDMGYETTITFTLEPITST